MKNLIEKIIDEAFVSKKQQRFFFHKANQKKSKQDEKEKWEKMAKEFSSETDFDKLPEKVEKKKEIEEVIDDNGNISRSKIPPFKKNSSDTKTTDEIVKTGAGSMGTHGVHGTHTSLRYWAESDMSKALGYEETLGKDEDYEDAKKYYKNELGLDDNEVEDRLKQIGYDKKLDNEKVRLIENPLKMVDDFIESVISKKNNDNEIIRKPEKKDLNPIVKKQLDSLKNSMTAFDLDVDDISDYLKENE